MGEWSAVFGFNFFCHPRDLKFFNRGCKCTVGCGCGRGKHIKIEAQSSEPWSPRVIPPGTRAALDKNKERGFALLPTWDTIKRFARILFETQWRN